jgi:methyl-accepting chemotaxis protein
LAILIIAGLLACTITNPVSQLTGAAQAIERGEQFAPERIAGITGSGDELGHLARVFSRMALEVQAREERLKKQVEQLRIEIDEVKKARQVAEITEADYFRDLRQHAAEMPFILTVYIGKHQTPKAVVVADALFCGMCKPQPEPIEMAEIY